MKIFNVSLGLLALAGLAGCVDGYTSSRGSYYSGRIWSGSPYCAYDYDYGCGYDNFDGGRIGGIWEHRGYGGGWGGGRGGYGGGRGNWGGGHGGWNHDVAVSEVTAAVPSTGPAAWQKEFGLSNAAVGALRVALDSGLKGDASKLAALGVDRADVQRLSNFDMPSSASIARAASKLGVSRQNLSDFVEVYTIRLKTAFANNQQ